MKITHHSLLIRIDNGDLNSVLCDKGEFLIKNESMLWIKWITVKHMEKAF